MNYKVKFSDIEKNIFNMIEMDKMRHSAMSVYAVMINSTGDSEVCTLSYKQIIFKTKRNFKMSSSMLKRRIEKLEELGLIKIIKEKISSAKQKYSYKIVRKAETHIIEKNEKQNEKENEKNSIESIENTSFIDGESVQNSKSKNIYNIYIKDIDVARDIAKELLKKLNIRKEIIKNTVIEKVEQVYKTINEFGARAYISTLISNTVLFFEALSKKINMKVAKMKSKSREKSSKRVKNFTERNISEKEFEDMYDNPALAFLD